MNNKLKANKNESTRIRKQLSVITRVALKTNLVFY